jgi:hypothetical protein
MATHHPHGPDASQLPTYGTGVAVADLDADGRPELIVFQVDNPPGHNHGYYKIGWKLDAAGAVTGDWSEWILVPDWVWWENQGGAIAIADLDGDGRPELVVFDVDNPQGQNAGYYKIGRNLDAAGMVTGGWSNWVAVPNWFPVENQGASIAIADLDGDGRPELIVFQMDGQDSGYYRTGRKLDAAGTVTEGWSNWVTVPDSGAWEEKGSWELLPYNTPVLPIHAALLHTNKVFFFAGSSNDEQSFNRADFRSVVWDYTAGTFNHPQTPIDFFCCGHAFLPDGRLLVAGGTKQYDPFHGLKDTYIFDPATEQWTATAFMAGGRWYPTLTALPDGRVLALSGTGEDGNLNVIPEIYSDPDGWQPLPNVGTWPLYAHLYVLRSGGIFYAGGQYASPNGMRPTLIGPTGTLTEVPGLTAPDQRNQCASVLLPPAQDQRVMIMGGGSDYTHMAPIVATANVDIVNLAAANPTYTPAAPLNAPRMHLNAVLLPDHTVLVTGGSRQEESVDLATLDAEIYNPVTNTWTVAAAAKVPRLYHSVALLLPDGRVVTAGSNPMRRTEELRLEVYSPPYLHKGPRPVIADVAQEVAYGATIQLQTAEAATIQWVSLIRPASTTHSNNSEQRLVDLTFQVSAAATLDVTVTNEHNLAPPGWYMLFITNQGGVPSVARWVHLI